MCETYFPLHFLQVTLEGSFVKTTFRLPHTLMALAVFA
jgi:hypothetical protein